MLINSLEPRSMVNLFNETLLITTLSNPSNPFSKVKLSIKEGFVLIMSRNALSIITQFVSNCVTLLNEFVLNGRGFLISLYGGLYRNKRRLGTSSISKISCSSNELNFNSRRHWRFLTLMVFKPLQDTSSIFSSNLQVDNKLWSTSSLIFTYANTSTRRNTHLILTYVVTVFFGFLLDESFSSLILRESSLRKLLEDTSEIHFSTREDNFGFLMLKKRKKNFEWYVVTVIPL